MFLFIEVLIRLYYLPNGFLVRSYQVGGQLANPKTISISNKIIIQMISSILRGESPKQTQEIEMFTKAEINTVMLNWRNFLKHSIRFLPHFTELRIELKLSSKTIIPDASLAISVPAMPIEKPTSAFFRCGASPAPYPVMATTLYSFFKPVMRRYLSYSEDR